MVDDNNDFLAVVDIVRGIFDITNNENNNEKVDFKQTKRLWKEEETINICNNYSSL